MAAVLYGDGTERDTSLTGQAMIRVWVSPATMDSADYVTVPTVTGATVRVINCTDDGTGDSVTATVSNFTVTLDAGGSDTDSTYVLTWFYEV